MPSGGAGLSTATEVLFDLQDMTLPVTISSLLERGVIILIPC